MASEADLQAWFPQRPKGVGEGWERSKALCRLWGQWSRSGLSQLVIRLSRLGSPHSRTWITGPKVTPLTCCPCFSGSSIYPSPNTWRAFLFSFGPAVSLYESRAGRSIAPGPADSRTLWLSSAATLQLAVCGVETPGAAGAAPLSSSHFPNLGSLQCFEPFELLGF